MAGTKPHFCEGLENWLYHMCKNRQGAIVCIRQGLQHLETNRSPDRWKSVKKKTIFLQTGVIPCYPIHFMSNGWYHMISHDITFYPSQLAVAGSNNSARWRKLGSFSTKAPGKNGRPRTIWHHQNEHPLRSKKNIHNQIIIIHKWFINVFENSSQQCEDGSEFKTGNHKRWSSIHFWVLQFAMWVVCNEVLVTQKELVIGCSSPKTMVYNYVPWSKHSSPFRNLYHAL